MESIGRPKIEYILKLDMAKELSMVENNEKGRQARKYFIECEKQLNNNLKIPKTYKEALLEIIKIEEEKEKLQLEVNHKTKVIDNLTENLDGVVLRVACTEYVNKIARETGKYHATIYTDMYLILGRNLKVDLKSRLNKYKDEQKQLVKSNIGRNRELNLTDEDRLRPITLKESKYNISMIEYICGVIGKGHELMEVMAKCFEVGIDEIIEKYKFHEEESLLGKLTI